LTEADYGCRWVFDIETRTFIIPGIDTAPTNCIYLIALIDYDDPNNRLLFCGDDCYKAIPILQQAKPLIGHNAKDFDVPAIEMLLDCDLSGVPVFDTVIASRLRGIPESEKSKRMTPTPAEKQASAAWKAAQPKRRKGDPKPPKRRAVGPHSLAAWGRVIGKPKLDFEHGLAAEHWNDIPAEKQAEMIEYVWRDVELGREIAQRLWSIQEQFAEALELETDIIEPLLLQQLNGIRFDSEAGRARADELRAITEEKAEAFTNAMKPVVKQVKLCLTKKPVTITMQDWRGDEPIPLPVTIPKETRYSKVSIEPLRPGQTKEVKRQFQALGWKPEEFTPTGEPKLDAAALQSIPLKQAGLLLEYRKPANLLSKVQTGEGAWLNHVLASGRIHGRVLSIGANTHRMSHADPNVAQVPKGAQERSLWLPSEGYVFVDVDAVSIEARVQAHFLYPFDGGAYRDIVLEGVDLHSINQKAINGATREAAKAILYAYSYGSGLKKLGKLWAAAAIHADLLDHPPGEDELLEIGQFIKAKFSQTMPGLDKLIEQAQQDFRRDGHIVSLDGRHIIPGSDHSAFNSRIQSSAAVIMKRALLIFHKWRMQTTHVAQIKYCANIHDEFLLETTPALAPMVAEAAQAAIVAAGEYYRLKCPMAGEAKIGPTWHDVH